MDAFDSQSETSKLGSPRYMQKATKNPEILDLLRNKKYEQLIEKYEKQPKIFDLPSEYTAAAIAYFA